MNNTLLVVGPTNTGKSSSLRNLVDRDRYALINCDGKGLPIGGANSFLRNILLDHPHNLIDTVNAEGVLERGILTQLEEADVCKGVIIDTLTFLMAMFERKVISTYTNTQKGWGAYGVYYENLMDKIKTSKKTQIVMAHTDTALNEQTMLMESRILVSGKIGKRGVDGDFGTVVSCKQVPLSKLEGISNSMLTITPEEEATGMKYVFMTRLNKEVVGDRTRAPMGMWDMNEIYIDNDVQLVLNRMQEFYS